MNQKQIALLCSVVIGVSSGSGILNHYCTGGYKIVVEGKTIGYVEDSAQYNEALNKVNDTLRNDFGEEYILTPDADISGVILDKKMISTKEELHDNIARLSSYMTDGYVLMLNSEELCSFKTNSDAIETLTLIRQKFPVDGGSSVIAEDVKIVKKQVSAASIAIPSDAAEMLVSENKLHVKTTINTTYHATKEFETIEEPDDTLVKGSRKLISEGAVGEYEVTAVLEYINGVQSAKTILSQTVISEPINEIVKIGTKEIPNCGTGSFIMPTSGRISSSFGGRWGRMHNGVDIATATGTPIKASDTGVVIFSGYKNSYGNLVKIDHQNGYVTYYAHCSELLVSEGEIVEQGQLIARVGNTGNSTGPHCHFEIQLNEKPQNPMAYVK